MGGLGGGGALCGYRLECLNWCGCVVISWSGRLGGGCVVIGWSGRLGCGCVDIGWSGWMGVWLCAYRLEWVDGGVAVWL